MTFEQQRRVFVSELNKAFEYVEYMDVVDAKARMYAVNEIIDEDIPIFMRFASYIGSLVRISYYKYVHKRGFDVRALADAMVMVLMFGDAYRFEFDKHLRKKEVKQALDATRYPEWTRVGLIGESTRKIADLGNKFSEYMDGLKAEDAA